MSATNKRALLAATLVNLNRRRLRRRDRQKFNTKQEYKNKFIIDAFRILNHLINQVLMRLHSKNSFSYLCDENRFLSRIRLVTS